MRYIKIPADPTLALIEMNVQVKPDKMVDQLREEIGGHVERVRIGWVTAHEHFEDAILLVDEEGNTSWKQLPSNRRAGYLYGTHIHGQPIRGDAILIGEGWNNSEDPEEAGIDFMDLPAHFTIENVELLLRDDDGSALFPSGE